MSQFSPAPEVERIAQELIRSYHDHVNPRLNPDVRIVYLFVDPTPSRNGKTVLGTCRKLGSLPAYMFNRADLVEGGGDAAEARSEPAFAIIINQGSWLMLTQAQRVALVDHELCHAQVLIDEEGQTKLSLIGHDIEEFKAVVRRHGLWIDDVRDFVDAAVAGKQRSLFDANAGEPSDAAGVLYENAGAVVAREVGP